MENLEGKRVKCIKEYRQVNTLHEGFFNLVVGDVGKVVKKSSNYLIQFEREGVNGHDNSHTFQIKLNTKTGWWFKPHEFEAHFKVIKQNGIPTLREVNGVLQWEII